ncbi:MAG: hypothetical protein ABSE16_17760 [Verrucomicrobiota bacterium]
MDRVLLGNGSKRLGLLGMRERLEMIGGCFDIASVAGNGTTITAKIPTRKYGGGKSLTRPAETKP